MRKKQWIILVIALAAIVAASAGLNGYQKKQDQKAAQQEEDEKVYALQFTSDDVTGISMSILVKHWNLPKRMIHGAAMQIQQCRLMQIK